jgi:hypothetical protein
VAWTDADASPASTGGQARAVPERGRSFSKCFEVIAHHAIDDIVLRTTRPVVE